MITTATLNNFSSLCIKTNNFCECTQKRSGWLEMKNRGSYISMELNLCI
jgi:hypothetical protein